jgi:hypothetical protein
MLHAPDPQRYLRDFGWVVWDEGLGQWFISGSREMLTYSSGWNV